MSLTVTYAQHGSKAQKLESGMVMRTMKLTFGDGVEAYGASGVLLDKASLGCPHEIKSLVFIDQDVSNGFVYKYDLTNNAIRLFIEADSADQLQEVAAITTPAEQNLYVNVIGW